MDNVKRESAVEIVDDNQVSRMSLSDDGENANWSDDSDQSSLFNTSPRAKRRKRRRPEVDTKVTRDQKSHLVKSLVNFKNDGQFTDYKIIVEGHPPIHVHKLIMAATSNFFQRVLASGMQEAITGEINMRGITYETAQILVNFSYGQPFEINSTNAQAVLEAADCYEFNLLKVHCEEFLLKNIDTQNCFDFLQLAEQRLLFKLKERTMQYALEEFSVVTDSEDFMRVPLPILTQFLCDDNINATREEQIFQVSLKWLKEDENRAEKAFDVLKCTRLALLAPRFLLDEVENNDLFKSPECVELINQAKKWLMLPFEERKQEACSLAKARVHSPVQEILVVIGGICNNKKLKEVDYYHKYKGWQSLAEISTEHQNMHSYSVIAHDNDIYITGGHSSNQCTVDIVSVYQSRYQKWIRLTSMNQARERHGSACVDGHIYVVGGLMAGKLKRKPGVLNDVERFNPMTQTWESVKNLPRRCYSPGVINYRNKLYVIGGVSMTDDTSQSQKVILDQVQVYCPVDDEWTCHSLSHRLARLSCSLYNGRVYIIANNSNIVYRYCPQTNKLEDWLTLSSVGANLEFAGLSAYNGQLFICGGQQEDNTLSNVICIDIDEKKETLLERESLRRPLCMHGCVVIDHYEGANQPSQTSASEYTPVYN